MIVIVDYGMGNLKSVQKAVEYLGKRAKITDSRMIINKAKKIIFPGVGHFGKAVLELKQRKIYTVLKEKIKEGIPFLGICLGMQLLLQVSEEAMGVGGLGVIKGKVKKFKGRLIVPHMGWNQVKIQVKDKGSKTNPERSRRAGGEQSRTTKNILFKGIEDNGFFYFAHSYYCQPEREAILSTTNYGNEFASSLYKGNVWAVQFHPEKSQKIGIKLLSNFLNLC